MFSSDWGIYRRSVEYWDGSKCCLFQLRYRITSHHSCPTAHISLDTLHAEGTRLNACSQHWTELNWPKTSRPVYRTRSLVMRTIVTSWLAAAKLGRLVLSQSVRCEQSRWNTRVPNWSSVQLCVVNDRQQSNCSSALRSVPRTNTASSLWSVHSARPRPCFALLNHHHHVAAAGGIE